jgi:hypothetical protein
MHYLKTVSKGWQGYTGHLNIIPFKNGISTEPVSQTIADRIAGAVAVVACDADGNEIEGDANVGIQYRLVSEAATRAALAAPLARQSDGDKSMEEKLDASKALKSPVDTFYTQEDLEKIADEGGIKALRVVGDKWKVKGKAIVDLMKEILSAQAKFVALRNAALEKSGGQILKATQRADEIEAEVTLVDDVPVALGFEGMAAEYQGPNDVVIPADALINAALKHSGKSLTGWNAWRDSERKVAIEAELEALSRHYGVDVKAVEAAAEVAPEQEQKPTEEETPNEDAPEQEQGESGEQEQAEGDRPEDETETAEKDA